MVTRILKYELDSPSGGTDTVVDTKNPPGDRQWDVQGIYCNDQSTNDLSLVINERKLIDNVQTDEIADEDNVLPFSLVVEDGDDLQILNTDDGNNNRFAAYVVVDEN